MLNIVEKSFLHFPRECVNGLQVRWESFFRMPCIKMFKIGYFFRVRPPKK